MNEIKCPKCGTVFQINETDYESIAKQIKDHEFEKELTQREEQYKKDKENAIKLAESNKDLEIQELKLKLSALEEQTKSKIESELSKKELEIKELKSKLEVQESKKELEIQKVVTEKDKKIDSLNNELEIKNKEHELKQNSIKEQYETKLKDKDEQIAYYKDFKAKQSTKMIGESLEQHCSVEFNRLRPLFKNAFFEKDNEAKTGSKGDFIFKDFDDDGNEIVSIMFEMKNEADETATKHKNEHFFIKIEMKRNANMQCLFHYWNQTMIYITME